MIFLHILMMLNFSFARDIIIKAEGGSPFDYEKHLEEHPNQISYIQHLGKISQNRAELKEKLKRAQFHFLEGSLEEARIAFKEIIGQRFNKDWKGEERKIIIYSLFRLAQIDKKEKRRYLSSALSYDKDSPIKEDLFPPPLIAEYKRLKTLNKVKVYPLPQNADSFDKILINGVPLRQSTSFFKANSGKKRFSFLSNSYKSVVFIEDPEALSQKTLTRDPMVTGDCQSPQIQKDFSNIPAYAFFSQKCLLPARGQLKELIPQAQYNNDIPPSKAKKRSWKKSTWLWIGASIVGAFATYKVLESQNRGRSQQVQIQPNNEYYTNTSSRQ